MEEFKSEKIIITLNKVKADLFIYNLRVITLEEYCEIREKCCGETLYELLFTKTSDLILVSGNLN